MQILHGIRLMREACTLPTSPSTPKQANLQSSEPVLFLSMANFFSRNIGNRGRLARALTGIALIITGLVVSAPDRWVCFALVASGGFVVYEAARGWCVMRACGIRTKI